MAITWTASANDGGITCVVPAYSSPAASDLLLLCVGNKYPGTASPDLPAGWTFGFSTCGGAGAAGVDSGSMHGAVFYKIALGTESGAQNVDIPSGNSAIGTLLGYSSTTGSWELAFAGGYEYTPATTWAACALTDPGATANDVMMIFSPRNANANGPVSASLIYSGVTLGASVLRGNATTGDGDDMGQSVIDFTVDSGTSTACPEFSSKSSASGTSDPAGVSIFVRIREVTAGAGLPTGLLQPMGIIF